MEIFEELLEISNKNKGRNLNPEDSEKCQNLIENYENDFELNNWLNCSKMHPKIRHFILRRFLEI
jgi:hypothetical protein